jgi:(p)ppGpp synthase/HD superfamily hydrolase
MPWAKAGRSRCTSSRCCSAADEATWKPNLTESSEEGAGHVFVSVNPRLPRGLVRRGFHYTPHMPAQHPWQRAAGFAARMHEHQVRKDGKTPYVSHPMRVTLTVICVFGVNDEAVITAGLLHDIIEDTTGDYDDILEDYGKEVADIVAALTKDMRVIEEQREKLYDETLARASWKARLIKLADVYDNLSDASTEESKRKAIDRGHRALKLAVNDIESAKAREALSRLVNDMQHTLT